MIGMIHGLVVGRFKGFGDAFSPIHMDKAAEWPSRKPGEVGAPPGSPVTQFVRCLLLRLDILVDTEQIVRVVLRLNRRQALVVVAVGRLDAVLALVHHHVDVGPAR